MSALDPATLRGWLEQARTATLATLLADARAPGAPFASVVPYALAADGRVVIVISTLAVHTKNLYADARASLLVTEPGRDDGGAAYVDVQAGWRATLVGKMAVLAGAAADDARARYLARHPSFATSAGLHGFHPWALDVHTVRWVAGFGAMGWL